MNFAAEAAADPRAEAKPTPAAAASPYTLSKETQAVIDQIAEGKCTNNIVQLTVDKETCVISLKTALPFDGSSRADRVERVLKLAEEEGPSLFIFRVDLRSNTPEWALLAWAPGETVTHAERMFYFTALSWLSASVVSLAPVHEFYVTQKSEMPSFHWS